MSAQTPCECSTCISRLEAAVAEAQATLQSPAGVEVTAKLTVSIPLKEIDILEREWVDISNELEREYIFDDDLSVTIEEPILLHISASGGNRIIDATGISHYVQPGWVHLRYIVRH